MGYQITPRPLEICPDERDSVMEVTARGHRIYYKRSPTVSEVSYDGTLDDGESLSITGSTWFATSPDIGGGLPGSASLIATVEEEDYVQRREFAKPKASVSRNTTTFVTGRQQLRDRLNMKDHPGIKGNGDECGLEMREMVEEAVKTDRPLYIAEGVYPSSVQIRTTDMTAGNLTLRGAGRDRTVIEQGVGQAVLLNNPGGSWGAQTSVTAQINPGDQSVSVASTAGFAVRDLVYFVDLDPANALYGGFSNVQQSCNSGWGIVESIPDSTTLVLRNRVSRTFSTSTLAKKFVSGGTIDLSDFTMRNPTPLSLGANSRGIAATKVFAPQLRRLRFEMFDDDALRFTDCPFGVAEDIEYLFAQDFEAPQGTNYELAADIDEDDTTITLRAVGGGVPDFSSLPAAGLRFTIGSGPSEQLLGVGNFDRDTGVLTDVTRNAETLRAWPEGTVFNIGFSGTPYSLILLNACVGWRVHHTFQLYGRHSFTTGVTDRFTTGGALNCLVTDTVAFGCGHAALDTHPGSMGTVFDGFQIYEATSQSIQLRGYHETARNGVIRGGSVGVNLPYGAESPTIENVDIEGVETAVQIVSSHRVKLRNLTGRSVRKNIITTDAAPAHDPMEGHDWSEIYFTGDMSGNAFAITQDFSQDWHIDWRTLRAPDATNYRPSGVNDEIASASTITVPANRYQQSYTLTGTTNITGITWPTVAATVADRNNRKTFFAQSAGLKISNSGAFKLAQDWISTADGSSITLQRRGALTYEVSRANDAAGQNERVLVHEAGGQISSVTNQAYALGPGVVYDPADPEAALAVVRWDPDVIRGSSETPVTLFLEATVVTNATAPGQNIVVRMQPVSAVAGSSGENSITLGSTVTNSSMTFNASGGELDAASVNVKSASFTAPAAGSYVLAVVPAGGLDSGASVVVRARLYARTG